MHTVTSDSEDDVNDQDDVIAEIGSSDDDDDDDGEDNAAVDSVVQVSRYGRKFTTMPTRKRYCDD